MPINIFYLSDKMAQPFSLNSQQSSEAFSWQTARYATPFLSIVTLHNAGMGQRGTLRMGRNHSRHFLRLRSAEVILRVLKSGTTGRGETENKRTRSHALIFVSCQLFTSVSHESFFRPLALDCCSFHPPTQYVFSLKVFVRKL